MPIVGRENYNTIGDELLKAFATSKVRVEVGIRNAGVVDVLEKEIRDLQIEVRDLAELANYTRKIYKDIAKYLEDRQEVALQHCNNMLDVVSRVVPDSDLIGAKMHYEKGQAMVIKDGADISLLEGAGANAILAAMLVHISIKSIPGALPFMAFDESFAYLSDVTVNNFRGVIEYLSTDFSILGVEQRKYIYDHIAKVVYSVTKEGNSTKITKESDRSEEDDSKDENVEGTNEDKVSDELT